MSYSVEIEWTMEQPCRGKHSKAIFAPMCLVPIWRVSQDEDLV